jgi:hypothetical protein
MLNFGVELPAEQDDNGGDPHPHHHADRGAKRAIGCAVGAEIRDYTRRRELFRADCP